MTFTFWHLFFIVLPCVLRLRLSFHSVILMPDSLCAYCCLSTRYALDNTLCDKCLFTRAFAEHMCSFFVQKSRRAGEPPHRAVYCQEGRHSFLSNMEECDSTRRETWWRGSCRCVFNSIIFQTPVTFRFKELSWFFFTNTSVRTETHRETFCLLVGRQQNSASLNHCSASAAVFVLKYRYVTLPYLQKAACCWFLFVKDALRYSILRSLVFWQCLGPQMQSAQF